MMNNKFKFLYALCTALPSAFFSFIFIYIVTRSLAVGIMSMLFTSIVVMVGLEDLFIGGKHKYDKLSYGGFRRIRSSVVVCGVVTGMLAACTVYIFFNFKAPLAIVPAIFSAMIPGLFLKMQNKY